MPIETPAEFEQTVRRVAALDLAERLPMLGTRRYLDALASGDLRDRFAHCEVEVDGVPMWLSMMVCAGYDERAGRIEAMFDMCLYRRAEDITFADHNALFALPAASQEAEEFDPASWMRGALAQARGALDESEEFRALREVAILRASIGPPAKLVQGARRI